MSLHWYVAVPRFFGFWPQIILNPLLISERNCRQQQSGARRCFENMMFFSWHFWNYTTKEATGPVSLFTSKTSWLSLRICLDGFLSSTLPSLPEWYLSFSWTSSISHLTVFISLRLPSPSVLVRGFLQGCGLRTLLGFHMRMMAVGKPGNKWMRTYRTSSKSSALIELLSYIGIPQSIIIAESRCCSRIFIKSLLWREWAPVFETPNLPVWVNKVYYTSVSTWNQVTSPGPTGDHT